MNVTVSPLLAGNAWAGQRETNTVRHHRRVVRSSGHCLTAVERDAHKARAIHFEHWPKPMRTVYLFLFLTAAGCSVAEQTPHTRELIDFEPVGLQVNSKDKPALSWRAIAEDRRHLIQEYLLSLGLSSTGAIQLIGVYHYHDDASRRLLHFQQLDLHGNRLFWSVLVAPESLSARVIYHTQDDRVSGSFESISDQSEK